MVFILLNLQWGLEMERWKATLKSALRQVKQAKNKDLDIKIERTGMAIENLLKAVLMKKSPLVVKIYLPSSTPDYIHTMIV